MKHLKYLKYLLIHKYWVLIAGLKFKAPLWRLIIHDWSKFLPSEWFPYVEYFYGNHPSVKDISPALKNDYPNTLTEEYWQNKFNFSWNAHQKRNKHHFQYWILTNDSGTVTLLEIPDKYLREMAADWAGAGRAITGKWDVLAYFEKNKNNTPMHPVSLQKFENLLKSTKLD